MNESLGRTWNGRYRWELRNPHHFRVLISLNKTMYNPSITKRPLILNVPRAPLTVKIKRLRYTISSHRTRITLTVRDIPLKPSSKFVCINIRNRLMPQYFNKTRLVSRSSILLLYYTSIPNIQNININIYLVVENKNFILFINACYMFRSIRPSSGNSVHNLKNKKMS